MSVGLRTLVLTQDFSPITLFPLGASTILAEDAIRLVLKDACRVVENYERRILTPSRTDLYWPSIIVNQVPMKNRHLVRLTNETLFWRDRGQCQYCHRPLTVKTLTKDHVHPTSQGGKHNWSNVVAACSPCNLKKSNQLPKGQWAPKVHPYTPTFTDLLKIRCNFPIAIDDEKWQNYLGCEWKGEIVIRKDINISDSTKRKMKNKYLQLSTMATEAELENES